MMRADAVPTGDALHKFDNRWKCVIVGGATMHPAELMEVYGNIDPRQGAQTEASSGCAESPSNFERSVWINPDDKPHYDGSHTGRPIQRIFPKFHLSVDGIGQAMQALVGAKTTQAA
jgi:uncharacterized protein with von Willebrand factor type A (vWA) domain